MSNLGNGRSELFGNHRDVQFEASLLFSAESPQARNEHMDGLPTGE